MSSNTVDVRLKVASDSNRAAVHKYHHIVQVNPDEEPSDAAARVVNIDVNATPPPGIFSGTFTYDGDTKNINGTFHYEDVIVPDTGAHQRQFRVTFYAPGVEDFNKQFVLPD